MGLTGTITEAKRGVGEDASVKLDHGTFAKWFVTISTGDKTVKTSILRKPDSPDPMGLPTECQNGRWKVAQQQGGKGSGKSIEETKAIQRQHSQEMALRLLDIAARVKPEEYTPEQIKEKLPALITWFEKDIGWP